MASIALYEAESSDVLKEIQCIMTLMGEINLSCKGCIKQRSGILALHSLLGIGDRTNNSLNFQEGTTD